MLKRYIEKFVENKKVPNESFVINLPDGNFLSMDLKQTIQRIYKEGKGNEVKKTLKAGMFRNAEMDKVLEVFESLAFQFLLDDYDTKASEKVKKILEESIRRKSNFYLHILGNEGTDDYFEVLFNSKNEKMPFTVVDNETKEKKEYGKRAFIEEALKLEPNIIELI